MGKSRIRPFAKRTDWAAAALVLGLGFSAACQAGDVFKGQELYTRHCAGCHGLSGEGEMPGLPNFARADKLIKTDSQLADVIRAGNGVMPSFNGRLTDEDIYDIVAYIRTFL